MRLKEYDYSQEGYYFVTICTKDKVNYLGSIVGAGLDLPITGQSVMPDPHVVLTEYGKIAESEFINIPRRFSNVKLDYYVIMPNHIHAIIIIEQPSRVGQDRPLHIIENPALPQIIGLYKSGVSRICNTNGFFRWQRNYYEHIIRNEHELYHIRQYIQNNPLSWGLDDLYNG